MSRSSDGSTTRAPARWRRKRWWVLGALLVGGALLWPGGPLRPRAPALRAFVPQRASLVVRLAPAALLDHAVMTDVVGRERALDLVAAALAAAGVDGDVSAETALDAAAFISEAVLVVVDGEPGVVLRLGPVAHTLAFIDRVVPTPDGVLVERNDDVVLVTAADTWGMTLQDADLGESGPGDGGGATHSSDATMEWSADAGDAIRLWSKPATVFEDFPPSPMLEAMGLAGDLLAPHRAREAVIVATLGESDAPLTLHAELDHGDVLPPVLSDLLSGGTSDARVEAERARALAPGERVLWRAGMNVSAGAALRGLLRDVATDEHDLQQLAQRIREYVEDGLSMAAVRRGIEADGDAHRAARPAAFVAVFRLRDQVDEARLFAQLLSALRKVSTPPPVRIPSSDGLGTIVTLGGLGPALVVRDREFIVTQDTTLIPAAALPEPTSVPRIGPGLRFDGHVDFGVAGAHATGRAVAVARKRFDAAIARELHGVRVAADLEASRQKLTGSAARAYREKELAARRERLEVELLPTFEDEELASAARLVRLGRANARVFTRDGRLIFDADFDFAGASRD